MINERKFLRSIIEDYTEPTDIDYITTTIEDIQIELNQMLDLVQDREFRGALSYVERLRKFADALEDEIKTAKEKF